MVQNRGSRDEKGALGSSMSVVLMESHLRGKLPTETVS